MRTRRLTSEGWISSHVSSFHLSDESHRPRQIFDPGDLTGLACYRPITKVNTLSSERASCFGYGVAVPTPEVWIIL